MERLSTLEPSVAGRDWLRDSEEGIAVVALAEQIVQREAERLAAEAEISAGDSVRITAEDSVRITAEDSVRITMDDSVRITAHQEEMGLTA